MAKVREYYWGDLRLWKTGLWHDAVDEAGVSQKFLGTDQDEALFIPASRNSSLRLTVHTYFNTHPSLPYTHRGLRATINAVRQALRARMDSLHPLCVIDEDDGDGVTTTISSFSGLVITTAVNPHGFSIGDHVLVRKLGVDEYTLTSVAATPAANQITVAGDSHGFANSNNVLRVQSWYDEMLFVSAPRLPPDGMGGDYHIEDAQYVFMGQGGAANEYDLPSVDLDA